MDFINSKERAFQIEEDKFSYAWDALIEKFNTNIINNTLYETSHPGFANQERLLRFLAREPRLHRRVLSKALLGLIASTPMNHRATRVIQAQNENEPFYVFLILPQIENIDYSDYRKVRQQFITDCCLVTKLVFPMAKNIVGIATSPRNMDLSEDLIYYDARDWSPEEEAEAKKIQKETGLLTNLKIKEVNESEYEKPNKDKVQLPKNPRNKPCPCGSGKKYKKCCGLVK